MCNLIHKHKPHIRLIQNAIRIIPVRWYKFSLQADFRPAITHNALALHFYSPLTKNIRTLELFLKINTKKSTNSQKIHLPLRWSFRKTFGTHTCNKRILPFLRAEVVEIETFVEIKKHLWWN